MCVTFCDVSCCVAHTCCSVMTCWPTEAAAIINMIDNFGTGAYATVMDSYDYTAALNQVLPGTLDKGVGRGGAGAGQGCV